MLILVFAASSPAQAGDISFSNTSVSGSAFETDFTIKNIDINNKDVYLFSLTTVAETAVSGASVSNDKNHPFSVSISPASAGWYGKDYLQWFKLIIKSESGTVTERLKGRININFSRPVFTENSINKSPAVKNNIFYLPVADRLYKSAPAKLPDINYSKGIKIEITSDGIYSISGETLSRKGVPLNKINTGNYRLFCKNSEQPIYITNSHHSTLHKDDKIMFYAKQLYGDSENYYTSYSFTNVYWLTWNGTGTGLRIADIVISEGSKEQVYVDITKTTQVSKAKSYKETVHIEHDNEIYWIGTVEDFTPPEEYILPNEDLDIWYWGKIGNKRLTQFDFDLCSPITNKNTKARITVALTGFTFIESQRLDHSMQVLINGENPANEGDWKLEWNGQADTVFTSDYFPASLLNHGRNIISFIVDDRSFHDISALNWIEVEYDKGYKTLDNTIQFTHPPEHIGDKTEFTVTGFSRPEIEIWDIENLRRFTGYKTEKEMFEKAGKDSVLYSVVFNDSITSSAEYFAVADTLVRTPLSVSLDTIPEDNSWETPENIDYIIVTVDSFLQAVDTLANLHRKRGLNVKTVSLKDIYNRFSYGIRNPEAIRSMLAYIYDVQEDSPPKYLLLCGDASHDLYKGYFSFRTIVPTHLTRVPGWGPASNDGYFATFKGSDYFPEMSVGRLPAQNLSQLKIMVDKTVNYLTSPLKGYWKDNLLLLGGSEIDFYLHNNVIENNIVNNRMNIFRMDANTNSPYYFSAATASGTIADYINSGIYALNFAGHGGGLIWSDSRFFSYSDMKDLHNSQWGHGGKLPFIFSFTCLTGFFESVHYISLGEEFLRKNSDGAIAFYSASGYSRRDMDLKMNKILIETAMNENVNTIGELISLTEMLSIVKYEEEAVHNVFQYNLLGDPALPWKLTPDTMDIELGNIPFRGSDTVKISADAEPVADGSAKIKISGDKVTWNETIQPVSGSRVEYSFPLKESSLTGNGIVRIYAWNDSNEIVGWRNFAKDTSIIHNVEIIPSNPAIGDSVEIRCGISFNDTTKSGEFICLYSIDYGYRQDSDFNKYDPVFMVYDSVSDLWKSKKKLFIAKKDAVYDVNKMLLVKFRVPGEIGETNIFSFPLEGRADLHFSDPAMTLFWKENSLFTGFDILNSGNIAADSFSVTCFWGDTNTADTLFNTVFHEGISPSEVKSLSFSIPDTQGIINFCSYININRDIPEISFDNNRLTGSDSIWYKLVKYPSDTLYSPGRGFAVFPSDTFQKRVKLFLLKRKHGNNAPLSTSSSWITLKGDGKSYFPVYTNPSLSKTNDSLSILFFPSPSEMPQLNKTKDTLINPAKIMRYDSLNGGWFSAGGSLCGNDECFQYKTGSSGIFGLASISDNTSPDIRVFVDGREILFLDFAARGKPFNIFIDDKSGVFPPSIELLQNSTLIDSSDYSSVFTGEDPSSVNLTASLKKHSNIDTLTIRASDYAGNTAEKSFAYMPGENLKIKFLSCHPNPFSAKRIPGTNTRKNIRFAFLITDAATKVKLEIFTISSKKIWKWENRSDIIGYQEVVWDGLSSKGYRIANGMYYAKLTAENESRKVNKIIKIAKLEGY